MFELFFSWDFWLEHSLLLMFTSAFLSATVLPGNSEFVFIGLASPIFLQNNHYFSPAMLLLLSSATLGNSLGSLTTYWIGRLFPPLKPQTSKSSHWAREKIERYGVVILLFSWLPMVGDVLCVAAGWLRLNSWQALFFILLGKALRYILLLLTLSPLLSLN